VEFVFAYIDPGSAAMAIQAFIAGLVAVPILLRHKIAAGWRAVTRSGSRDRKDSSPQDPLSR
jgi:hypothetical protein